MACRRWATRPLPVGGRLAWLHCAWIKVQMSAAPAAELNQIPERDVVVCRKPRPPLRLCEAGVHSNRVKRGGACGWSDNIKS